jgi:AmmeMemoRadiSam system protein A
VVGYAAVALLRNAKQHVAGQPLFSLNSQEKKQLLEIARKSVESAVKEDKLFEISGDLSPNLAQDRGAFVTIRKNGELRGCVGYTAALQPLALTVRDVAAIAALSDTRFRPVTPDELSQLQYEVSVLSPFHRVLDINQIRVGEHGLLMKNGSYEGLLLPQVASEQRWDRKMLLAQTAVKAGLPANAWRSEDTDIFMFSALVFGEAAAPTVFIPEDPFSRKPMTRPGDQGQDLPRR